jgi:disulfide bond formation protein DsbB
MNEVFLKFISFAALFLIIALIVHIILDIFKIQHAGKRLIATYRLELLFLISLVGTVGSLLLSIYFKLQACELCWYQRIFLFALPILTAIAIIKKHIHAHVYVFWLALTGFLFALYHSLLQTKLFITSDAVFCNSNAAIDCAVPAFTYFGFVTIPVISLSIFLLLVYISYEHRQK